MKKLLLTSCVALAFAFSASAQTTQPTTRVSVPGLSWNASDWNIPPYVVRYLKTHPKAAKKVYQYYQEHGELPPFPPAPPTIATSPVQSQITTANVQWPKAPAAPAAIPVGSK